MKYETHKLRRGVVHVTRAENVYPDLDPGSVTLVISDGPYGMGKAAWDRQKGPDGLREWYRPHVETWGRVCADAASVYLWGTQRSVRALQPLMEEHGWTWRTCVVWDKVMSPSALEPTMWADVTESCDVYTRGAAVGIPQRDPRKPNSRGRPSLLFNVWRKHSNSGDLRSERLASGSTYVRVRGSSPASLPLHPCQKPLVFSERIIRASSRPGDLVLEPFGGTLRAAVACEMMPEAEARRYVCIEPDEDGRGYVPAALADLRDRMRQPGLFGGAG